VFAVLAVSLAGCAASVYSGRTDVTKTAFGSGKRFAVVSIAGQKVFRGPKGFAQMFKSDKDIPGSNTQPMLDALSPRILKTMSDSRYISLMPARAVLHSRAYRQTQEDKRVRKVLFFSQDMNVAKGYKYITDPKKMARLASQLGVDGVIGVTVDFSLGAGKNSFSIAGLSFGKKSYYATASVIAVAYDRTGKPIWKDSTMKEADPGDSKSIVLIDTSDMTATNFEKMQPSAIKVADKALHVLMHRFSDTMAGRTVAAMQSVK